MSSARTTGHRFLVEEILASVTRRRTSSAKRRGLAFDVSYEPWRPPEAMVEAKPADDGKLPGERRYKVEFFNRGRPANSSQLRVRPRAVRGARLGGRGRSRAWRNVKRWCRGGRDRTRNDDPDGRSGAGVNVMCERRCVATVVAGANARLTRALRFAGLVLGALVMVWSLPALAQSAPTVTNVAITSSPANGDTYERAEAIDVEVTLQ